MGKSMMLQQGQWNSSLGDSLLLRHRYKIRTISRNEQKESVLSYCLPILEDPKLASSSASCALGG